MAPLADRKSRRRPAPFDCKDARRQWPVGRRNLQGFGGDVPCPRQQFDRPAAASFSMNFLLKLPAPPDRSSRDKAR